MLEILKPGLYTTLQDKGRKNCSHLGIPTSGAMDSICASDANKIIGNKPNSSVLECTIIGPQIKFFKPTIISITGAVIQPFINGRPSFINEILKIEKGDVLSFGRIVKGARFYIAIHGGFHGQKILKSQSACITSSIMSLVKKHDEIQYSSYEGNFVQQKLDLRNIGNKKIEAQRGCEYDTLEKIIPNLSTLFHSSFNIKKDSNRMAYRVSHENEFSHNKSILSSATIPGTVQLTPAGDLIFLMRDAQTTGGYPRVLQLTETGICNLSQLKAGESFEMNLG